MNNLNSPDKIRAAEAAKTAIEEVLSDSSLIREACNANPWFTPYFIERAGEALIMHLNENEISAFLNKYPENLDQPKNIGVIMAANLPFVGFMDMFHVFLSGNKCLHFFSSRDKILMQGFVNAWMKSDPGIRNFILPLTAESKIDFIIATGSDNTARYTQHHYQEIPNLIRKNRFSVAIMTGDESPKELENLTSDILLFNGMGCRNVSNILMPVNSDSGPLMRALDAYPEKFLSESWKERMKWECALAEMLPEQTKISKNAILHFSPDLNAVPPGHLNVVEYQSIQQAADLISLSKEKIQCVVGHNSKIAFGSSHQPSLDDFADGVDLMEELMKS